MRLIWIIFALVWLPAHAQVSDKALHAGASALIGSGVRLATNSQAAAFAAAMAVGVAKEVYDAREGGTGFSGKDIAADLVGAVLATLTPPPNRIGVMGRSFHRVDVADGHLTGNTPGVMYGWRADWLPVRRGYVDAAVFSNSQGYATVYAGVSAEWRVVDRLYLGAGVGATWGYRRYEAVVVPKGTPGLLIRCYPGIPYCANAVAGKPRVDPALMFTARVPLEYGVSVIVTYLPAGTVAKMLNRNQDGFFKDADAVTVGLLKEF